MTQVTNGKRRNPASIGYNNLIAIPLARAGSGYNPTVVSSRLPLGLNLKIMAVSFSIETGATGPLAFNVVQGTGSYETAGSAPAGAVAIGGTFVAGDQITTTVGGVPYTVAITSRNAGNNLMIAADIASGICRNQPFGVAPAYFAGSVGTSVNLAQVAYNTTGNSTTLTSSVSSASGTATASASTLLGGTVGVLPTAPALDNSNQTSPAATAAAGTALFPIDVPLLLGTTASGADVVGIVYPAFPRNFDAIWPAGTELTMRYSGNSGTTSAEMNVVLWAVPYDVNAFNPELKANGFIPNITNL